METESNPVVQILNISRYEMHDLANLPLFSGNLVPSPFKEDLLWNSLIYALLFLIEMIECLNQAAFEKLPQLFEVAAVKLAHALLRQFRDNDAYSTEHVVELCDYIFKNYCNTILSLIKDDVPDLLLNLSGLFLTDSIDLLDISTFYLNRSENAEKIIHQVKISQNSSVSVTLIETRASLLKHASYMSESQLEFPKISELFVELKDRKNIPATFIIAQKLIYDDLSSVIKLSSWHKRRTQLQIIHKFCDSFFKYFPISCLIDEKGLLSTFTLHEKKVFVLLQLIRGNILFDDAFLQVMQRLCVLELTTKLPILPTPCRTFFEVLEYSQKLLKEPVELDEFECSFVFQAHVPSEIVCNFSSAVESDLHALLVRIPHVDRPTPESFNIQKDIFVKEMEEALFCLILSDENLSLKAYECVCTAVQSLGFFFTITLKIHKLFKKEMLKVFVEDPLMKITKIATESGKRAHILKAVIEYDLIYKRYRDVQLQNDHSENSTGIINLSAIDEDLGSKSGVFEKAQLAIFSYFFSPGSLCHTYPSLLSPIGSFPIRKTFESEFTALYTSKCKDCRMLVDFKRAYEVLLMKLQTFKDTSTKEEESFRPLYSYYPLPSIMQEIFLKPKDDININLSLIFMEIYENFFEILKRIKRCHSNIPCEEFNRVWSFEVIKEWLTEGCEAILAQSFKILLNQ